MQLSVKKLDQRAKLPQRQSKYAAGYDLYSLDEGIVPAKSYSIIRTGISIQLPKLEYPQVMCMKITSRSGLSAKFGIEVGAGLIDFDYTGEIKVILHNHSNNDYIYNSGERIAQGILQAVYVPDVKEVEELASTERGSNGFGSTGLN
jgi:dUTP pyrophosphatase